MTLLLLCSLLGLAQAASRLLVEAPGTLTVILDSTVLSSGAGLGRYTAAGLSPGRHTLQIKDSSGQVLGQSVFELPDNTSATATWNGGAIVLVGASQVSGLASSAEAPFKAEGDVPAQQDLAALQAANDQDASNQIASAHGQRAPVNNALAGGRIPDELTRYAGQAVSTSIGLPSIVSNPVVSTVGSGFVSMVQSAEAGGMRRSYSPDARQGNPNLPPPILEDVKLLNLGGLPMTVYVDGMWLVDFGPGQTQKTFKIEVGRRELQFVDPVRKELIYQGSLRVKKDYVVVLEFSPSQAPRATNANWAWAGL